MRFFIIFCFFVATNFAYSQITITGKVTDSIGSPLELANVIAVNNSTKNLDAYGITDDSGRYKLSVKDTSAYTIKASYIGMKTAEVLVNTNAEPLTKNITLYNDNTLDEVELTYEMPVTVKGDTIMYNADSFTTGSERKLEDVLEKLPGFEVLDDGNIKVQGKTVTNVMVDGKKFFDGDTKLATKNIPSNAVDKVEVLRNHSDVSQLKSVANNNDNVALNIKLKKGKSNFWFGNVTLGAGKAPDDNLYLAQPKLFYYSPKLSVNIIGDLNNIGEMAFTRSDYFRHIGGFGFSELRSKTNLNLGNGGLNLLNMQNENAKDIKHKFEAVNFTWSPKKALTFSGISILSNTQNRLQQNNTINYIDESLSDEITQTSTFQKSDLSLFKVKGNYKPNFNNELRTETQYHALNESEQGQTVSSILDNVNQYKNSKAFSFLQNVNYYYTLNDNNIFASNFKYTLQEEDPFYNAVLNQQSNYVTTAEQLQLNADQDNYNITQANRIKTNRVDVKLDYWNVLTTKSNLNITFNWLFARQNFNSRLIQVLDNQSQVTVNSLANGLAQNDTDYRFNDLGLGFHYTLKTGKFTIVSGATFKNYRTKVENTNEKFEILPDLDVRLQLKQSESLNFNYSMENRFVDVTKYAQALVMRHYNSFYVGNDELENSKTHKLQLSYNSHSMFNYTSVNAFINYNKRIDAIRSTSDFTNIIRVSSPFNSMLKDESLSAYGRFQKTFGKIITTINGQFNYSKFHQIVNQNSTVNKTYNQTYNFGVRTNYKTAPNVEFNYRYAIQNNYLGNIKTTFYTHEPKISFDAELFKSLLIISEYRFNDFRNADRSLNKMQYWDASLNYRKDSDSNWEFEVKATNLLNTKALNSSNNSLVSVSFGEYIIQPRFVTFRVKYNL